MYVYCTYESARSKNVHVHVLNAIRRLSRDQDVLRLGLVLVSSRHTVNTPIYMYINLCCKRARVLIRYRWNRNILRYSQIDM